MTAKPLSKAEELAILKLLRSDSAAGKRVLLDRLGDRTRAALHQRFAGRWTPAEIEAALDQGADWVSSEFNPSRSSLDTCLQRLAERRLAARAEPGLVGKYLVCVDLDLGQSISPISILSQRGRPTGITIAPGAHWNALIECLRDLDATERAVLEAGLASPLQVAPRKAKKLRHVSADVVASTREKIVGKIRTALEQASLRSAGLSEPGQSRPSAAKHTIEDESPRAPSESGGVPSTAGVPERPAAAAQDLPPGGEREPVGGLQQDIRPSLAAAVGIEPGRDPSVEELWSLVRDEEIPAELRADALAALLAEEPLEIPAYVLEQIVRSDLDPDWRDQLLFAVEEVDFWDGPQRTRLKEPLLELASQLRDSDLACSRQPLWSALRSFAALALEEEASRLLQFLRDDDDPDTQRVALLGVQRIFSAQPPSQPEFHEELAARILDLADFYTRPQLLRFDDTAALALEAFHALAALGDSRIIELADRIVEVDIDWFADLCQQRITETVDKWRRRSRAEGNGAIATLEEARAAFAQRSQPIPATADR